MGLHSAQKPGNRKAGHPPCRGRTGPLQQRPCRRGNTGGVRQPPPPTAIPAPCKRPRPGLRGPSGGSVLFPDQVPTRMGLSRSLGLFPARGEVNFKSLVTPFSVPGSWSHWQFGALTMPVLPRTCPQLHGHGAFPDAAGCALLPACRSTCPLSPDFAKLRSNSQLSQLAG